jgi:universal stress protein E
VEVLQVLARSLSADVLVMGAVSRSRLQELFVGTTAERVLDRLPCDVLIVKPAELRAL